MLKIDTSKSLW